MFASVLVSVVFVVSFLYLLVTLRHGYWRRRNIPGPAPTFFGGNIGKLFSSKQALGEIYGDIYRSVQMQEKSKTLLHH